MVYFSSAGGLKTTETLLGIETKDPRTGIGCLGSLKTTETLLGIETVLVDRPILQRVGVSKLLKPF